MNGIQVMEYDYDNYETALEDAKFAYEETGVPHEIKIVNA